MKLIYCMGCNDVKNLTDVEKSCACGNVRGKYIDDVNVEVFIDHPNLARVLGISNGMLVGVKGSPSLDECAWVLWLPGRVHPHVHVKISNTSA